jgi:hypothetical protein
VTRVLPRTAKTGRQTQARPACADCTTKLAKLLRKEGLEYDVAQTLARTKSLAVRVGDGWMCPRCSHVPVGPKKGGKQPTKPLGDVAQNRAARRAMFKKPRRQKEWTAEIAANLAEEARRDRQRRERRAELRRARKEQAA